MIKEYAIRSVLRPLCVFGKSFARHVRGGLECPQAPRGGFSPGHFPDRRAEGVGGYRRRSGTVRVRFTRQKQCLNGPPGWVLPRALSRYGLGRSLGDKQCWLAMSVRFQGQSRYASSKRPRPEAFLKRGRLAWRISSKMRA